MMRQIRLAAVAASLMAAGAHAQNYPAKPIYVLIPLQAGSAGDAMLRIVVQKMSENLGQQFIVENQPGAAGLIGAQRLARMAPDGYAIGGFSDSVVNYAPSLAAKPPFDPVNDFAPISFIAGINWIFVVHPSLPAKNVREFIALAKAQPGKLDYSSAGNGSPQQVAMELFKSRTGIVLTHIPYKGATQQVLDVVGGQIPATFTGLSIPLPFIKDGRLRALATPSEKRLALIPDVPTMNEAGVQGFLFNTWLGIYAPKATPRAIIDRLNSEAAKVLTDNATRERLVGLGFEPRASTPEDLSKLTREGYERVRKVIKDAGIKVE